MSLEVLIIGCGRDGTTSIYEIVKQIYKLNGEKKKILHECDNSVVYASAFEFIKNKNKAYAKKFLNNWKHNIEVGNGYSFILPVFKELYSSSLKIIHIQRNKKDNVNSIINHTSWRPDHWGNYTAHNLENCEIIRPTAVDYKELSKKQWNNLNLKKRIEWYYDKTHELVLKNKKKFIYYHKIKTEQLNDKDSLKNLTKFLNKNFLFFPDPQHLNANLNYKFSELEYDNKIFVRKFWRNFDHQMAFKNKFYILKYVIKTYIKNYFFIYSFLKNLKKKKKR